VIELPASETPRASIVIVAIGDGPRLRTCLRRLAALDDDVPFEVIVVLCGCDAGQAETLRSETRAVEVLHTPVNLGLAGALNLARGSVRGEFIVSLHDDADPAAGWLRALVTAADAEPEAGAVGSLVLNPDGSVQAAGGRLVATGGTRAVWDGQRAPSAARFTDRRPVDYCPSCSLLVRVSSWDRVGGADERFFPIYYVDVDLCLAIRARGEGVLCEPASVVAHHRGSSTDHDYAMFLMVRNRELLLEKWGDLVRDVHAPGLELPTQERARDASERERAQLLRHLWVSEAYAAQLRGERDRAREWIAELDPLIQRLQGRADTLARIESGGWWRLRGRIRPLLRMASAARRLVGRD
jgi:GT2 family glycosyltransferase